MYKFVVVVACVVASAQAGHLHGGLALAAAPLAASGPALGAPLLGSVSYNAPETTIVKQPVVVDQPEIRYRSVPYVVNTAPIVNTVQPVIHPQPVVTYAAAAPVVRNVAGPALTYAAGPAFAVRPSGAFSYGYSAPAFF